MSEQKTEAKPTTAHVPLDSLVSFYRRWKYRHVDPSLCCCGQMMSHTNQNFDSVCQHAGGCRSMKDYLIEGN